MKEKIGYAGILILLYGTFAPLICLPAGSNINYFSNGHGDGILIIALLILAVPIILSKIKYLWVIGVLSVIIIANSFAHALHQINNLHGIFAYAVQLQYGWILLFSGSTMLIATKWLK